MRIKNLIPLVFMFITFIGATYSIIPEINKSVSLKNYIFLLYYTLILLCTATYFLGVHVTIPADKNKNIKTELFYYLPLFLFITGAMIFSYILFPVLYQDISLIKIIFFSSLALFSLAYCLGMIFVTRYIDGKELFLSYELYNIGILYSVPVSYGAAIIIPFVKESYLGSSIGTYVGISLSIPIIIMGLNRATSENKSRSRIYKYLLLLLYLIICWAMVMVTPTILKNNLGSFVDLIICYLSIPYIFTLSFVIGMIWTRMIYPPEK